MRWMPRAPWPAAARRGCGLFLAGLVGVWSAGASAGEVLCHGTAWVEPGRGVVGQPLTYVLEIVQRRDVHRVRFEPPPTFPAFQAAWLPTVDLPDPDEGHRASQERRALHPAHAGRLVVPPAGIACEAEDQTQVVRVPAIFVEVRAVPEMGRPAGWAGLVGRLELSRTISAERMRLGDTLRVSLRARGRGNLWLFDPLLERALAGPAVDVFAHPLEIERDAGRSLELRAHRIYDVVPRRVGPLAIPALRIPYFDPQTGSYAEASLPAVTVAVAPRAPTDAPPALPREPAKAPAPGVAGPSASPWARTAAGAGALALAAAGLLWARRRHPRRSACPGQRIRRHLEESERALRSEAWGEAAAALARALRVALEEGERGGRARPEGDAAARPWRRLAERLERARFAGESDPAEIRALHEELRALVER